jgi:hypothetical protein
MQTLPTDFIYFVSSQVGRVLRGSRELGSLETLKVQQQSRPKVPTPGFPGGKSESSSVLHIVEKLAAFDPFI